MLWLIVLLACEDGAKAAQEGEKKAQVDPRSLVEAAPVAQGSVAAHLSASGIVEANVQATLMPETTGRVTALYVEEGDTVKTGQLLAIIASPVLDASYQRALTQVETATTDAQTADRLFAQGALSKAEQEAAHRALSLSQMALNEASRTRGFTRLTSPINGVIASRGLRFGEMAGPTPAFVIVDPSQLRVVIHLPERELARVHTDQIAQLSSAWDEKTTISGTVTRISPVVDPASGTFKVTVALSPEQTVLRPGQYASVKIEVDRHDAVMTLARRALVWEEGNPYVYKLAEGPLEDKKEPSDADKDASKAASKAEASWWDSLWGKESEEEEPLPGPWRRVVRTGVSLGYEDGEQAEIVSGLSLGEQVVVVGNEALRDGARVRLPGDPTVETPTKEGGE